MPDLTYIPQGDLFFDELIKSQLSVPHFVERGWLWDRINQALSQPAARYILFCGEPGSGKSAFMAWMAHQNPDWPRYFIRRDQRLPLGDIGVRSFLLQVGFQLAARFPELFAREQVRITVSARIGTLETGAEAYGVAIEKVFASPFYRTALDVSLQVQENRGRAMAIKIDEWVTDPRLVPQDDLAYMAFIDPVRTFARLYPEKRLAILVDALDELRYRPRQDGNLLDWLVNCTNLPEQVKFVLSSRDDLDLLAPLRSQPEALTEIPLDTSAVEMRRDSQRYAICLAREPHVRKVLGPGRRKPFVIAATNKANGNFSYMNALERAVHHARHNPEQLAGLLDLSSLPNSLTGLYAHFFRRVYRLAEHEFIPVEDPHSGESGYLRAWPAVYKRILSILAVAMEPLRVDQVAALGEILADQDAVVNAFTYLGQFLDWEGLRARLYHATLAEFLCDPKTERSPETLIFYVDAARWHRRIADYYRTRFLDNWENSDDYGLEYTLHHLQHAGLTWTEMEQRLHDLLSEAFIKARGERAGWHRPLARDLERIQQNHPLIVVDPCVEVLGGSHRNSLVNQEILRLLASLHPSPFEYGLKNRLTMARSGSREYFMGLALQALEHSPERAVLALMTLVEGVADVQIKGVAALALGETGSRPNPPHPALPHLIDILLQTPSYVNNHRDCGHLRWCAADALIALGDTACTGPLIEKFWQGKTSPSLKQQIIYVLGRLKVQLGYEEKRRLIDHGLGLRQDCVPRFADAIYLLAPESAPQRGAWRQHYERLLWQGLGFVPVESDPVCKVWTSELTRKRAITALGRIGSVLSRGYLEKLVGEYHQRQPPLSEQETNLLQAIQRALQELR